MAQNLTILELASRELLRKPDRTKKRRGKRLSGKYMHPLCDNLGASGSGILIVYIIWL